MVEGVLINQFHVPFMLISTALAIQLGKDHSSLLSKNENSDLSSPHIFNFLITIPIVINIIYLQIIIIIHYRS
jgi:hypothetical protein